MPETQGRQCAINFYEETAYGSDPGSPNGRLLPFDSESLVGQHSLIDSNRLQSKFTRIKPIAGNQDPAGDIVTEVGPEWVGTWLKHLLGAPNTTGAGPYVHTFTPAALPTGGLLIEKDYGTPISGNRFERFNGIRIEQAQFRFTPEGYLIATWGLRGSKRTQQAAVLDATITDDGHTPFKMSEVPATLVEEGGSDIALLKDVVLTHANELKTDNYVVGGSGIRRNLVHGRVATTATFTALFESAGLLDKAVAGTATSLKVACSRGDGLGSAGNELLELLIQNMVIEPTSPQINGPQGIEVSFRARGYLSGSTEALQVVLKNAVATV